MAALLAHGLATATGTVSVAIPLDHSDLFAVRFRSLYAVLYARPCRLRYGPSLTRTAIRSRRSIPSDPIKYRRRSQTRRETPGCSRQIWKSIQVISVRYALDSPWTVIRLARLCAQTTAVRNRRGDDTACLCRAPGPLSRRSVTLESAPSARCIWASGRARTWRASG